MWIPMKNFFILTNGGREDIFLARALEDPIFISVKGKPPTLAVRDLMTREQSGLGSYGAQNLDIANSMILEGDECVCSCFFI